MRSSQTLPTASSSWVKSGTALTVSGDRSTPKMLGVNPFSAARLGRHPSTTPDAECGSPLSAHRNSPSVARSEEHTSELQSLMRISYAVFCLKKKNKDKYT